MTREEGVYVAFGQYWLQARHQETARLWMTNIVAIVFGALLAVVAWQGLTDWYVAAFGLSLALFGFFTNHALRVLSVRYSRVAATLMDIELGLGDYRRFIEGGEKQGIRGTWENLWSLHIAYVMFYCFGIAGWAALLTMTRSTVVWATVTTFVLVLTAVLTLYRLSLWPREREAAEEPIASTKRQKERRKVSTTSEPVD